jgi:hypothetical protein
MLHSMQGRWSVVLERMVQCDRGVADEGEGTRADHVGSNDTGPV